LITALVLYEFGTGPIKGFAVTLSIGIVTSVFSALVVTRLLFHLYPGSRTTGELSI
jgi:preprotein translocase subunit SecD